MRKNKLIVVQLLVQKCYGVFLHILLLIPIASIPFTVGKIKTCFEICIFC